MNIAMAYHKGDRDQAIRWLNWVKELGGIGQHKLFLMCAFDCEPIPEIIPFTDVKDEEKQQVPSGQREWLSTEQVRSAAAPNSMFRQFAWKFYMQKLGPWMFIEPDAIPISPNWHDKWYAEFINGGKPFCGGRVLLETVQEHLTGNAIYCENVPEVAPSLVMRSTWTANGQPIPVELAFDVAGARETVPKSHWTTLIQHKFRFKGFESRSEFDAVIDPNAVVFHSDKSGSIYPYLRDKILGCIVVTTIHERENLSGNVGVASRRGGSDEAGLGSSPAQSNLDAGGSRDPGATAVSNLSVPEYQRGDPLTYIDEHGVERIKSGLGNTTSCKTTVVNQPFTSPELIPNPKYARASRELTDDRFMDVPQPRRSELQAVIAQNSVIKNGLPGMSPPWENKEDTERDIKMLCDTLKLFCGAPVYKGRVREALREAKIIK